ncbi:CDP-glycerol glycerophosphotransferase family protein [Microbulbifer sp. ZKSA002]|uniref:CDP-glycerol glycerophosphotransferase family protein n=1 Tax=Microbulbifer sp. ZKSA002 TaxID=3243388 RepID=UPI004039399D
MSSMKICIFTLSLKRQVTGIDKFAVDLCSELKVRGYEVFFITTPGKLDSKCLGLDASTRVYSVLESYRSSNVARLRDIICLENPDLVLPLFSNSIVSIFISALKGLGIPLLLSEHNDPEHYLKQWWYLGSSLSEKANGRLVCFHAADKLHVLNPEYVKELPGFIREKVTCIENPLPAGFEQNLEGLPKAKVVISIGRLEEASKGLSYLILAFSLLKSKHKDWRLFIYGDGPDRNYYRELIKKEGLQETVLLMGLTETPEKAMREGQIFCIPSVFEGCPLTLIEAKAIGLPAIGFFDCRAIRGMIEHERDGLLVQRRDPESLAASLGTLFDSPAYISKLSKGSLTSSNRYNRKDIFDKWDKLIRETVRSAQDSGTCLDSTKDLTQREQLDYQLSQIASDQAFLWGVSLKNRYANNWKSTLVTLRRYRLIKAVRLLNRCKAIACFLMQSFGSREATSRLKQIVREKISSVKWVAIQKIAQPLPSVDVVFIDVPGFNDMRSVFGGEVASKYFFEDSPLGFMDSLRIARAKVIVTAGGAAKLNLNKRAARIELWHASGAVKKFADRSYAGVDTNYYIIAPSQNQRKLYAQSFGVDLARVFALGVPKTDILLRKDSQNCLKHIFFKSNPDLQGKKIYVFAPTFRGEWPADVYYNTALDFNKLSDLLRDDECFLVKLHPSLNMYSGQHNIKYIHEKIIDASSISIDQLIAAADVVISDYSSIIFDCILANKKLVLFAEDIDYFELERGFSYDYRNQLPCQLVEQAEASFFLDAIRGADINSEDYEEFKKLFLTQCDGLAVNRVKGLIDRLLAA